MKAISSIAIIITLAAFVPSCASKQMPDAEWNRLGIWHRVSKHPPTYIPTGYSQDRTRAERDGRWFTDKRDGKRIFVPHERTNGFASGALEVLAGQATATPVDHVHKTTGEVIQDTVFGLLYFASIVASGVAH